MDKNPLVSVIIVTYRTNLDYIFQAIDSVKRQSYKNIEIIIISDEPSKDANKFFLKLAKQDITIIYKKNEKKTSVAIARNQWILLSKWKYIAMLDDDDIRNDKNKLLKQVKFLENNVDYGFCWADKMIEIDLKWNITNLYKIKLSYDDIKKHLLQRNQFVQSSILIRKESLCVSGIYDASYYTEDYELWCRIWKYYKFCNLDSSVKYRIVPNSLSHKNESIVKWGALKVCRKYRKYYPNWLKAIIMRLVWLLPPKYITFLSKLKQWLIKLFK